MADTDHMCARLCRLAAVTVTLLVLAAAPSFGRASAPPLTRLLQSDMSQPSQALPQGVPTWYDWATHPRPNPVHDPGSYRAFTPWGQLYQCAGTRVQPGETTQLRDLQTWVLLRGSDRWTRVQETSAMSGGAFAEDYAGPTIAADYSSGDTATVVHPVRGHNFHFWPEQGRIPLRPSRVRAVTVAVQARLAALRAPAGHEPCLTLSVGGDLWGSFDSTQSANQDIGIGRFKRVEPRWRLFTMSTASDAILDRDPPPAIGPSRFAF
jgi:hypothetical protein